MVMMSLVNHIGSRCLKVVPLAIFLTTLWFNVSGQVSVGSINVNGKGFVFDMLVANSNTTYLACERGITRIDSLYRVTDLSDQSAVFKEKFPVTSIHRYS
jgi:hypothetical protein